jgi:hypothetical protein
MPEFVAKCPAVRMTDLDQKLGAVRGQQLTKDLQLSRVKLKVS